MRWSILATTFLLAALLIVGCGNDLEFGTNKEDSLRIGGKRESSLSFGIKTGGGESGTRHVEDTIVQGNIFNVRPATARSIVVFVFVDLQDPGIFHDFRDAEVGIVKEDKSFLVSHLAAGSLTVVFLLDQVGIKQDGTIDPGDPIAIFQDPAGRLNNISANTRIMLHDVDLMFNVTEPSIGTARVRSVANVQVTQG
ncbi:MAG: hypothetical protein AB7G75_25945 [Candidatus Binatia bacterium]